MEEKVNKIEIIWQRMEEDGVPCIAVETMNTFQDEELINALPENEEELTQENEDLITDIVHSQMEAYKISIVDYLDYIGADEEFLEDFINGLREYFEER